MLNTGRNALTVARDRDFTDIVLASDCLSMIQRILSPVWDRSFVGTMVGDIKRLAASFSTCSFKHYGRDRNVAAHLLARSSGCVFREFSFAVLPECIRKELCNDAC